MTCGSQKKNEFDHSFSRKPLFTAPPTWPICQILLLFYLILTPLCDHTFKVGLDLTCSSSQGLNSDDFPFFYFLNRTSRSRISSIQRFIGNWGHLRNLLCGKSLSGAYIPFIRIEGGISKKLKFKLGEIMWRKLFLHVPQVHINCICKSKHSQHSFICLLWFQSLNHLICEGSFFCTAASQLTNATEQACNVQ